MQVWGFVIPVVGMLEVEIRLVRQGEGFTDKDGGWIADGSKQRVAHISSDFSLPLHTVHHQCTQG